jgi:hypothetical protein
MRQNPALDIAVFQTFDAVHACVSLLLPPVIEFRCSRRRFQRADPYLASRGCLARRRSNVVRGLSVPRAVGRHSVPCAGIRWRGRWSYLPGFKDFYRM